MGLQEADALMEALRAPFDLKDISFRAQPATKGADYGFALCYMDARAVMKRLDGVVGSPNWSDSYEIHAITSGVAYSGNEKPRTISICTLKLRLPWADEWVSKSDGAGESDIEGEKGSISDSFKRAAVKWGIGRYLYDMNMGSVKMANGRITPEAKARLPSIYEKAVAAMFGTQGRVSSPAAPPPQAEKAAQAASEPSYGVLAAKVISTHGATPAFAETADRDKLRAAAMALAVALGIGRSGLAEHIHAKGFDEKNPAPIPYLKNLIKLMYRILDVMQKVSAAVGPENMDLAIRALNRVPPEPFTIISTGAGDIEVWGQKVMAHPEEAITAWKKHEGGA